MGRTGLVFVTKMHLISARESIYVYINKCRQKSVRLKFSFPIIYPFHGVKFWLSTNLILPLSHLGI